MFKKFSVIALLLGFSSLVVANISEPAAQKKVILVIHDTSFGKGFLEMYQALKSKGHDVKVLAIPFLEEDNSVIIDIDMSYIEKFDAKDVVYPCGNKAPYKTCKPLGTEKADYIILGNPYNTRTACVTNPQYTLSGLKDLANKAIYIVYGPHLFHYKGNSSADKLKDYVHIAMVDSESTKKLFIDEMKFSPENVVVSGYQSYKNVRDKVTTVKKDKSAYKETILWLPRWRLDFKNRDEYEGGSTFLSYYHFICNYAEQNPDIRFIIRPHGGLFPVGKRDLFLSEKDVDAMFARFNSLKNVVYSQHVESPIEDDVVAADIIISDGTSGLGEVVVADKPIIYLSNGWNNEFNSNDLAKEFKNYIYMAYGPKEVVEHIETIRKEKYAAFNGSNRAEFKKKLDSVENPAEFIADYIASH